MIQKHHKARLTGNQVSCVSFYHDKKEKNSVTIYNKDFILDKNKNMINANQLSKTIYSTTFTEQDITL